jgi:hypothetical protein
MTQVDPMNASPQRQLSYSHFVRTLTLLLIALFGHRAFAEIAAQHTTLVIFADHPMEAGQWAALVSELHRSQPLAAITNPALAVDFDTLRGENVSSGLMVQSGISIYLHGDCTLLPRPHYFEEGALGWVPLIHGRIQPFVHVDCARIVNMLAPLSLGMHRDRRESVMAEAIARVIVHEWIHIATQNRGHSADGVTKSQFLVKDLLAEDEQLYPRQQNARNKKRQSGF